MAGPAITPFLLAAEAICRPSARVSRPKMMWLMWLRLCAAVCAAFFVDRRRVHIGDPTRTVDVVFNAWQADRSHGLDAVTLAPTRELVRRLIQQPGDHRLAGTTPAQEVLMLTISWEPSVSELRRYPATVSAAAAELAAWLRPQEAPPISAWEDMRRGANRRVGASGASRCWWEDPRLLQTPRLKLTGPSRTTKPAAASTAPGLRSRTKGRHPTDRPLTAVRTLRPGPIC